MPHYGATPSHTSWCSISQHYTPHTRTHITHHHLRHHRQKSYMLSYITTMQGTTTARFCHYVSLESMFQVKEQINVGYKWFAISDISYGFVCVIWNSLLD